MRRLSLLFVLSVATSAFAAPPSLELPPPGPKPEQVGPKQDFPFLKGLPGWTIDDTSFSPSPMDVETADGKTITVHAGTVTRSFRGDEGISPSAFEKIYEAALVRAGWTIGDHNAEQGFLYAHYDRNGRDIWVYLSRHEHVSFEVAEVVPFPKLVLTPPSAKPEKVGDNDDFPWLKPMPGWKLDDTSHSSSPLDVETAKGDTITVKAGTVTKSYRGEGDLSNIEFENVYEAALVKAGWTLGQKNENQGFLYAHWDKNGREIWVYLRRNEHPEFMVAEIPKTRALTLVPPAEKPEAFGDRDPFPYLTPLPGWKLLGTQHDTGPLTVVPSEKGTDESVGTGSIRKIYQPGKDLSNVELVDVYEAALVKAGWTIGQKNETQGYLYAHYAKNGRDLWAYLRAVDGVQFSVSDVADVGTGLKHALAKQCKVAVYGVNFDFDKARLRPDATPVLTQVLALFKDEPGLSVEIGGHTDNVGSPRYNLKLSGRRADAVKRWLVAHGIAASRLSTHGYGQTQPLVPNTTDENRAKNRRVELKKPGCKE